jgi:phosphoglycolate phosphatase (TIGR01487 family)
MVASPVQALALDYDGTLTGADRPDDAVLDAIRDVRAAGRAVILVTGRILSELRAVFPDVEREFDAVVGENGAVLVDADGVRDLAEPVHPKLARSLAHRDIPVRQGRVLLACDVEHVGAVVEEIARLELDCQVVRNRAALMVLPGGVTKGTGLVQALGNLGISRHSTLAVGDAENDHHLFAVCEIGVAVANAVDALKDRADLVLNEPDGAGVVQLLTGPLVRGEATLPPGVWQLTLGVNDAGLRVKIPASQVNLLITGASCSGKSYVAGLLVEQLVRLDYSVLVLDREGDHRPLGDRRGLLAVGGHEALPSPRHLAALLRHRFSSVVVDLSQQGEEQQRAYVEALAPVLLAQRAVTGLPHWIVFDEAHVLGAGEGDWAEALAAGDKGFCFSTYRPDLLPAGHRNALDVLLYTDGGGAGEQEARRYAAELAGIREETLQAAEGPEPGRAVLLRAHGTTSPIPFTVQHRTSGHVRHWHKYIDGRLPAPVRFYFTGPDQDRVAANLREFHRHLGASTPEVVEAHARRHDFSRWVGWVLQDDQLAETLADAERRLRAGACTTEVMRAEALLAIETRYLE